jgi:hypothetical protein
MSQIQADLLWTSCRASAITPTREMPVSFPRVPGAALTLA